MAKKPTSPSKSSLGQFADTAIVPAQEAVDAYAPSKPMPLTPTKHREKMSREFVDIVSRDAPEPKMPDELASNSEKSFYGSFLMGRGYVIEPAEAQALIESDSSNSKVLFPFMTGQDLNSSPDQSPSRWTINFFDWPLDRANAPADYNGPVATDFPQIFDIAQIRIQPERALNNRIEWCERWWQYAEKRSRLYELISKMSRVIALSRVNNHLSFAMLPASSVFDRTLVVFPLDRFDNWSVLQSSIHCHWAWHYGMANHSILNYSPSVCFKTYPFPSGVLASGPLESLALLGERYHAYRSQVTNQNNQGLRTTQYFFHDRRVQVADFARLRALQVEMDQAVAAAYGWGDLDLGHGFHPTEQGERFTISEPARREVLDRLLALNHQRYEEELKAGLHNKKKPKPPKSKNPVSLDGIHPAQPDLLPPNNRSCFEAG
jgi:hypothetical protein